MMSAAPPSANSLSLNAKARSLRAQKEIWHLEQEIVASLVRLEQDSPIDTTIIADNPIFHLVRDNHHDVFSFSSKPELYGGLAVNFADHSESPDSDIDRQAVATYVIVDRRTMKVVHHDHELFIMDIPHMTQYHALREISPMEILVRRQIQNYPELTPQSILVDGDGVLHPRHAGIACFLGTRVNIPTIGVGRSMSADSGHVQAKLNHSVDHFLKELYDAIEQNPNALAPQLSKHRGLIMKKVCEDPTSSSNSDRTCTSVSNDFNRTKALQELAPFCNGIAIPMKGEKDDRRFPILGCALVGHGGRIAPSPRSNPVPGTVDPVFVSVGHKISLQQAVQTTASLSLGRIPEPLRQAEAYGVKVLQK